ncbi:ABC transporter permease [Desulfosarcina sp.]|uniref:ABC transporter permease n=1 Tax=Desulfosarcina sp. TaxID=2027861 RepID=UPI0035615DDB
MTRYQPPPSESANPTGRTVNPVKTAVDGTPISYYESQTRRIWRRFLRHRLAVIGGCVVLLLLLMVVFANLLSPHDPLSLDTQRRFIPPLTNASFVLGTDEMGRDLLSRLFYGGRISLVVGVAAMFATIVTGLLIGLIAGFYGGRMDNALMRFTDTMLCFPQVFLLLVLAAFITPTVISIALIIGLTSWMEVARIIRAQIQYIKEQDFIQAAIALGASESRIMFKELLPNAIAPVLVSATLNVANAVLMESYISFLGYGIQPPLASWGNMLTNAQSYFDLAPWLAILPGLMITLTVMSFNFLGDGLRDALDPRLRM